MLAEHVRDVAMTAVIFGFFATTWFGWAQEDPPRGWRPFLIAGTVAAVITAAAGGRIASQHWTATVFDEDTSRTFGIVVGIEFAAAAAGSVVLAVLRRRELMSAWIAFVVGVHLFPVAAILGYPFIYVIAVLVTIVSLVGVPIARARNVAPSAIVGAGSGASLLVGAIFSAVAAAIIG